MSDDDRLYGVEGSEDLHEDLEDVLDEVEDDSGTLVVEEWTILPPERHLPPAETIIEDAIAWIETYGKLEDDWYALKAFESPDVLAAAEALRRAIATTITYRMADRHVATWDVTWTTNPDSSIEHTAVKR